jgi:non-ribosomal peptide synthetase component F
MVVGILGILKSGAAYVPLDASYPRARLEYMLADAGVSVVLTEGGLRQLATEISTNIVLCLDDVWAREGTSANLDVPVDSENLAYVMYTSGSTGQPKGVMIAHRNVNNVFRSMDDYFPGAERGTWLSVTSVSFDVSVVELLWTLTRGARLVIQKDPRQILPDGTSASDESVTAQLSRHGVTHLQCTPSLARTLLIDSTTRAALGSLQYLALAGEALTSELAI